MATMKYLSALGQITMLDVEHLWAAMRRIDAVDDALASTSMQGKPALRALLSEAYHEIQHVMRKGARRGVKLGAQGAYTKKNLDPELVQRLVELAGAPAAADDAAPAAVAEG